MVGTESWLEWWLIGLQLLQKCKRECYIYVTTLSLLGKTTSSKNTLWPDLCVNTL